MRRQGYEAQWKQFITVFFPELLLLLHPELHAMIDWSRGYEFLEQELLSILPDSRTGVRVVDKLVRVYLKNGAEQWILIHIEIQSTPQGEFAERVYIYNTLAWLNYRREVVSIALLTDKDPNWRPNRYERGLAGCRTQFEFVACKLIDFDEAQLRAAAPSNPAALMLLAFRRAMESATPEVLFQARVELTRLALELGYTREQVREILRLLEWAMKLPKELEREYRRILARIKREERTPYLASFEREAIRQGLREGYEEGKQEGYEEGKQDGLRQGLLQILADRYGAVPVDLQAKIAQVRNPELILRLYTEAIRAADLQTFEQALDQHRAASESAE